MIILFNILKIFICIIFIFVVVKITKNQDTSISYGLMLKSKITISKMFSVRQLSNIEISFKKLNIPYNTFSIGMILIFGFLILVVSFIICSKVFNILLISVIISYVFFTILDYKLYSK